MMRKLLENMWGGWIALLVLIMFYFTLGRIILLNYPVIAFNIFTVAVTIVIVAFFYALPHDKIVEKKKDDEKFKAGSFDGDDA
jgi:hypothetical protein